MRHIMVMNAKGGCGKTTVATNLASLYAVKGIATALVDYDPQASSLQWLASRPPDRPAISGVAGFEDGMRGVPRTAQVVVSDVPARTHKSELSALVRRAETILVPVLPSPIDIHACTAFVEELLRLGKVERAETRVAVVANRVRENTLIFEELESFLQSVDAPYLGALREAQNYVRAYQRGVGVFELPQYLAWQDWEQWESVVDWLNSRASLPA